MPLTTATFCAIAESEANAASATSKRADFKFFMGIVVKMLEKYRIGYRRASSVLSRFRRGQQGHCKGMYLFLHQLAQAIIHQTVAADFTQAFKTG